MGNSLRCCLACVLPCGALDLIRIVHLNGNVEEITASITAGEFLKSYPNYVLSKPSSHGVVRKIMILSHDSELKKGNFYFLIPQSSLPSKPKKAMISSSNSSEKVKTQTQKVSQDHHDEQHSNSVNLDDLVCGLTKLDHENGAVSEAKPKSKPESESKPKSGRHKRRRSSRGKSGVWQPQLESITEDL